MSKVRFAPVAFEDLPGWTDDAHADALNAFGRSLVQYGRAHAGAGGTPAAIAEAYHDQDRKGWDHVTARAFFERYFTPHKIVHEHTEGLLTGYFEPVLMAATTRSEKFAYPLYRTPPQLARIIDDSLRGALNGQVTHTWREDGAEGNKVMPPTRQRIDEGALRGRGLEIAFLADPVDAYFLHVQGSGVLSFEDGTTKRVSYAAKNGYPYTSIGRYLIDEGHLDAQAVSLDSIKTWLTEHPEQMHKVLWQNRSYIFFRVLEGCQAAGPVGVHDIPLTPGRSLAVDAAITPVGTPVFVSAPSLSQEDGRPGFHRLMVAQDVGSAIKGPERGDIFYGTGDIAGHRASTTKHPGNFFVLLPGKA